MITTNLILVVLITLDVILITCLIMSTSELKKVETRIEIIERRLFVVEYLVNFIDTEMKSGN